MKFLKTITSSFLLISLLVSLFISCANLESRSPSSSQNEVSFQAEYKGYHYIVSENIEELSEVDPLQAEFATELCQNIGATYGSFVGLSVVDFGGDGPDWGAEYSDGLERFILVEKNKFVSASHIICTFPENTTCDEDSSELTLAELISGKLTCVSSKD